MSHLHLQLVLLLRLQAEVATGQRLASSQPQQMEVNMGQVDMGQVLASSHPWHTEVDIQQSSCLWLLPQPLLRH